MRSGFSIKNMPRGIYIHKKGRRWKVKDTSRLSAAKKGHALTEEHKRNIKAATKGQTHNFKGGLTGYITRF